MSTPKPNAQESGLERKRLCKILLPQSLSCLCCGLTLQLRESSRSGHPLQTSNVTTPRPSWDLRTCLRTLTNSRTFPETIHTHRHTHMFFKIKSGWNGELHTREWSSNTRVTHPQPLVLTGGTVHSESPAEALPVLTL